MTLKEIERIVSKREIRYAPGEAFVGDYQISSGNARLWFQFGSDLRLISYVLQTREGMHSRLSPRQNVCTGELTFRLRLHPGAEDLLKAVVYLDGRPVGMLERVPDLTLAAGEHELLIEPEQYPRLVHRFALGPSDRGDQLVGIDLADGGKEKRVIASSVTLR